MQQLTAQPHNQAKYDNNGKIDTSDLIITITWVTNTLLATDEEYLVVWM